MKKTKFNIQGMTCSSCSAHVEKAVKKLNGVKEVNVNLLSNNMIVEYNEKKINEGKIIQSVIDAGYGADLEEDRSSVNTGTTSNEKENIKSMKKRVITSFIFLIPLMYIAMHNMLNEWIGLPIPNIVKIIFHGPKNALVFAFTQFLLLLPIIYVNRNYFIVGFKRLFKGSPNMDSLIAIGSSAATIYGIFAICMIGYGLGHNQIGLVEKYSMDIYFESAGTILTLITFGKYLEAKSKGKTSEAISKLLNLTPKTAIVIRDGKEIEIKTENIIEGDIVIIKPGTSIPVDGIVIEGNSAIDQSSITGESVPVQKTVGNNIVSGTINKNGYLKIRATKVGDNTTLAQIIKLVEEASNSKAPISKLADKVSLVFVPFVIIIAAFATIFWILNGQSFEFAFSTGIAVLVISCPCALGLATPVAIMVGTGKGAQNGILIKSAESLELLHQVDTIVFDKTGTITVGKPKVVDIVSLNFEEKELLKIAASLENKSEHPLSEAIIERAKQENIQLAEITEFESFSGRGIRGKINGKEYFGGNINFMKENNIVTEGVRVQGESLLKQGKTVLYFANVSEVIGIISVTDTVKQDSFEAVKELKNKKINVMMITGDNKVAAMSIGKSIGIENIISEVLPADKEKEVTKIQKTGKKVAFVGDGINDSPALVRADVGIAIGSGTDIAIESADVVLMKNTLMDVVTAIDLSTAVIKNIKMNLFWAFFYNIIGIPIAAGAFYFNFGFKLNPMIGAAAMSLSSVCVVTNALRLKNFKSKYAAKIADDIKCEKENVKVKSIIIEGMQCNHCKTSVEKALKSIDGVTDVIVALESKKAVIKHDVEIEDEKIVEVIEEAGFVVRDIIEGE